MATTTSKIECINYIAKPGQKLCMYYVEKGGCARKDEFMCSEWVRKNPHLASAQIENVGQPDVKHPSSPVVEPAATEPEPPRRRGGLSGYQGPSGDVSKPTTAQEPSEAPKPLQDRLRSSRIDVDKLKKLVESGIEAKLEVPGMGTICLVPSYTEQQRQELTFGDASMILAIIEVFPKAELTEITKPGQPRTF